MKSNLNLFDGYVFVLILQAGQTYNEKQQLRKKITSRGGKISYMVTRTCHFLVLGDDQSAASAVGLSTPMRTAKQYGIPIVNVMFLDNCVQQGTVLDPEPYCVHESIADDQVTSACRLDEEFQKGVVLINGDGNGTYGLRSTPMMGQRQLKVWPFLDPDGPQFHAGSHEIAKFAILKGCQRSNGETPFCVLEFQVSAVDEWLRSYQRYCVFAHIGNMDANNAVSMNNARGTRGQAPRTCRYSDDSKTALDVYCKLYKTYTNPPHSLVPWSIINADCFMPSGVGSPQFQKMIEPSLSNRTVDDHVEHLVDHLWTEAIGQLDSRLTTNVNSISQENLEKADGILREIGRRIDSEAAVTDELEEEYYTLIPQKHQKSLTSSSVLAQQHDLVQLIRDILTTSESVGEGEIVNSAMARHNALGCSIVHLPEDTEEFSKIRKLALGSGSDAGEMDIGIQILNIFVIRRPLEDAIFQWTRDYTIPNVKLLFHASAVRHFVGILARGLLLPKMASTNGTRGPCDLGSGIYFADKASTSMKYGMPSKSKGTRLMAVAEVILGNCFETTERMRDLMRPPEGHHSVHGVRSTGDNPTDFEEDEYVIFNVNQQKLRYLIEFCHDDDDHLHPLLPLPANKNVSMIKGPSESSPQDAKSTNRVLQDLMSIKHQRDAVQWGLQTLNGRPAAVLREVHVRAELLDLAAKVVVMQLYTNRSAVAIEAKYVFPLDDLSAVCGFEAFINDKHVVGVIEEKQKAHRQYQAAIKEGHGAYMMDQETPEVFVVSLGNLPPKAEVIIKITYLNELVTEGDKINFTLPANLAPWVKPLGLKDWAMDQAVAIDDVDVSKSSLEMSIEMPFLIRSIISTTHEILLKRTDTMATVKLRKSERLDRDFQLCIGLAEIHVPRMWVERHPDSQSEACMLTFYPVFENDAGFTSESSSDGAVIFLLDASNSMERSGAFVHAQAIALLGLHHLKVNWTFNVIIFGSIYEELFPIPQEKSPDNVKLAEEFVLGARANFGNTRLVPPISQFLLIPQRSGQHQNVFLISDGYFSDSALFHDNILYQQLESYRIFTFGIDSPTVSCNRHVMRNLASRSAGAFEVFQCQATSKWNFKVKSQLDKAGQPVLTDVHVEWQQLDDEAELPVQAPRHLVTLFNGARQVIYSFIQNCSMATLHAKVNGKEISTVVSTSEVGKTQGKILHAMTARAIIRDWEDGVLDKDRTGHEASKASMKSSIISLSKEYSILTSITSFVAIEKREPNSSVASTKASLRKLLKAENVDKLSYIAYTQDEDGARDPDSESELEPITDELATGRRARIVSLPDEAKSEEFQDRGVSQDWYAESVLVDSEQADLDEDDYLAATPEAGLEESLETEQSEDDDVRYLDDASDSDLTNYALEESVDLALVDASEVVNLESQKPIGLNRRVMKLKSMPPTKVTCGPLNMSDDDFMGFGLFERGEECPPVSSVGMSPCLAESPELEPFNKKAAKRKMAKPESPWQVQPSLLEPMERPFKVGNFKDGVGLPSMDHRLASRSRAFESELSAETRDYLMEERGGGGDIDRPTDDPMSSASHISPPRQEQTAGDFSGSYSENMSDDRSDVSYYSQPRFVRQSGGGGDAPVTTWSPLIMFPPPPMTENLDMSESIIPQSNASGDSAPVPDGTFGSRSSPPSQLRGFEISFDCGPPEIMACQPIAQGPRPQSFPKFQSCCFASAKPRPRQYYGQQQVEPCAMQNSISFVSPAIPTSCPVPPPFGVRPPPYPASPSMAPQIRVFGLGKMSSAAKSTSLQSCLMSESRPTSSSHVSPNNVAGLLELKKHRTTIFNDAEQNFGGLPLCSAILKHLMNDSFDLPANVKILIQRGNRATNEIEFTKVQAEIEGLLDGLLREDEVSEKTEIERIFMNQENGGGFKVSALKVTPLTGTNWIQELDQAGLRSLGDVTRTSILDLVATITLILYLFMHGKNGNFDSMSFDGLHKNKETVQELLVRALPLSRADGRVFKKKSFLARLAKALLYVTFADRRRHPLVYSTLQLGANWEAFVIAKVLA